MPFPMTGIVTTRGLDGTKGTDSSHREYRMPTSVRYTDIATHLDEVVGSGPTDFDETRRWLGLTQEELAEAVGRSRRTVARWRVSAPDHTVARGETARRLRELGRIQFLLDDLMGRETALEWLRRPNRGFRGEAPVDLILEQRASELIPPLEALADGGPQ